MCAEQKQKRLAFSPGPAYDQPMSPAIVIAAAYVALLFGGTALAHRYRHTLAASRLRIHAYGLALAVYCTSWTYFGAVGSAA